MDNSGAPATKRRKASPSPNSHTEGVPSLERAVVARRGRIAEKRTDCGPRNRGALSSEEPYLWRDGMHLSCTRIRRRTGCSFRFLISTYYQRPRPISKANACSRAEPRYLLVIPNRQTGLTRTPVRFETARGDWYSVYTRDERK